MSEGDQVRSSRKSVWDPDVVGTIHNKLAEDITALGV